MNLGGEILIACLGAASPDALARLMLMQDPVAASLTVEQQYRLACAALEEGDKVGVTLCSRHQSMAPEAIACALGVTIVDTQEPSWAGPFLRYADLSFPPTGDPAVSKDARMARFIAGATRHRQRPRHPTGRFCVRGP